MSFYCVPYLHLIFGNLNSLLNKSIILSNDVSGNCWLLEKQCSPWSDALFLQHLIWVYPVSSYQSAFILRENNNCHPPPPPPPPPPPNPTPTPCHRLLFLWGELFCFPVVCCLSVKFWFLSRGYLISIAYWHFLFILIIELKKPWCIESYYKKLCIESWKSFYNFTAE